LSNTPRYLITTSDELTWKLDRPVIFLGEWCREFERKEVWSKLDAIVAKPYGTTKRQKVSDLQSTREIASNLFPEFYGLLNDVHGLSESERFWKIILGHWFRRHIEVTCNRTNSLRDCLEKYEISGTTFYDIENYELTAATSAEATTLSSSNLWNNTFYKKILSTVSMQKISIDLIENVPKVSFGKFKVDPTVEQSRNASLHGTVSTLGSMFKRKNDAMIINSYMPPKMELKLQMALRQFPQLNVSPKFVTLKSPDYQLRSILKSKIQKEKISEVEALVRETLFDSLPICFLEAFSDVQQLSLKQPWPATPKFIFTSNNFDSDEVFKVWAANKVKSGVRYIVGQHGNGYGTHRFFDPTIEEETADNFLTWGWGKVGKKHSAAFMLSQDYDKHQAYDSTGCLSLMVGDSTVRLQTWDESYEFNRSIQDTELFIASLRPEIRNLLVLKAHPSSAFSKWRIDIRWNKLDSEIKRVSEKSSLPDLISKSRLVVHTYDSTGLLKTLAMNVPTIAFWQDGMEHLLESAVPYYELLIEAGIVHFTPESAAQKINEIWNDTEGWWRSAKVQNSREEFTFQFARISQNPIRDLKRLLIE